MPISLVKMQKYPVVLNANYLISSARPCTQLKDAEVCIYKNFLSLLKKKLGNDMLQLVSACFNFRIEKKCSNNVYGGRPSTNYRLIFSVDSSKEFISLERTHTTLY